VSIAPHQAAQPLGVFSSEILLNKTPKIIALPTHTTRRQLDMILFKVFRQIIAEL
jgi:hypothetical protein